MRILASSRARTLITAALLFAAPFTPADDGTATSPLSASLRPSAHLAPEDVVRIQLEALRKNDGEDRGIAVAFRFASPANKRSTGPLPRFISMIRNGPYSLMLAYRKILYAPVRHADRKRARCRLCFPAGQAAQRSLQGMLDDGGSSQPSRRGTGGVTCACNIIRT
jgi:hypothetical protein